MLNATQSQTSNYKELNAVQVQGEDSEGFLTRQGRWRNMRWCWEWKPQDNIGFKVPEVGLWWLSGGCQC